MAEPTTREYNYAAMVLEADKDHYKRDVCYEFSNGRRFLDTDNTTSGVYGGHLMDADGFLLTDADGNALTGDA
ncbi:MAG: hypothetical protein ABFD97_20360 [Syntrophobacter sp.]